MGQFPASYDPVLSIPGGTTIPAAEENRLLYSALPARQAKVTLLKFEAVLITNALTENFWLCADIRLQQLMIHEAF